MIIEKYLFHIYFQVVLLQNFKQCFAHLQNSFAHTRSKQPIPALNFRSLYNCHVAKKWYCCYQTFYSWYRVPHYCILFCNMWFQQREQMIIYFTVHAKIIFKVIRTVLPLVKEHACKCSLRNKSADQVRYGITILYQFYSLSAKTT